MLIEDRFSKLNATQVDPKFSDRIRVYVQGGNGGNGCAALFQASYGQILPNGGDGGNGGDVYFQATSYLRNLYQLRRAHFKGNNGGHGTGKCMDGKNGKSVRHSVPVGTEIYKIVKADPSVKQRQPSQEVRVLLGDLDEEGKELKVASGGKGGLGNYNHRHIKNTDLGQEGEYLEIELVLKTLADVGLVGFPNAGKSTFLASVSRAFPKIAPYPFTTLRPYVGKWNFIDGNNFTIADLPGLIEGAHANKGLGHSFLKHIERTKVILYILDGTGDGKRRPVNDYQILRRELELYDKELLGYKSLIAINKSDREHTQYEEKFKEVEAIAHTKCIPMSAKMSINIQEVILHLRGLVFDETPEETIEKLSKYEV